MVLSRRSIDTLLDLVENKLSCMEVFDREDARELAILEHARRELAALAGQGRSRTADVVPFTRSPRRAAEPVAN
ncbi:MAG TPA: hypothetical protein VF342_02130 [Alphaproteobacteria bacterium]